MRRLLLTAFGDADSHLDAASASASALVSASSFGAAGDASADATEQSRAITLASLEKLTTEKVEQATLLAKDLRSSELECRGLQSALRESETVRAGAEKRVKELEGRVTNLHARASDLEDELRRERAELRALKADLAHRENEKLVIVSAKEKIVKEFENAGKNLELLVCQNQKSVEKQVRHTTTLFFFF